MSGLNTRLEEIKQRLEKATPGPLVEREDHDYYQGGTYLCDKHLAGTDGYICRVERERDKELLKFASADIALLLKLVQVYQEALVRIKKEGIDTSTDGGMKFVSQALTKAEAIARGKE